MLTLRGLRERQTQICVNMLGKLLTLALLMLALSKQSKGPPGAFQARAWKANNCSLGQEQTYYTLGLYSNISGQALLRKTCDDAASLPKPPAPQWHGLRQLEWKPFSWSNPALSMEALGSPWPSSLHLLKGSSPIKVRYLLNSRFPKPGLLSFPIEQPWICLVCLFLLRRGWSCPASWWNKWAAANSDEQYTLLFGS